MADLKQSLFTLSLSFALILVKMFSFYTENDFAKCQDQIALVNLLKMCKNENDTKQLQFLSKTGVGASTCVSQIYMFQVFAAHLYVCSQWARRSHHQHELQMLQSSPSIYCCCCVMPGPAFFNKKSRLCGLTPVNIYGVLSFSSLDLFQVYITLYYLYPTLFSSNILPTSFFGLKRNIEESLLHIWFALP